MGESYEKNRVYPIFVTSPRHTQYPNLEAKRAAIAASKAERRENVKRVILTEHRTINTLIGEDEYHLVSASEHCASGGELFTQS